MVAENDTYVEHMPSDEIHLTPISCTPLFNPLDIIFIPNHFAPHEYTALEKSKFIESLEALGSTGGASVPTLVL